jgi:hypothetical protein
MGCQIRSGTLSNSESIRRILKYVVETSVSGHAKEIKEYTTATEALKCPQDFDTHWDAGRGRLHYVESLHANSGRSLDAFSRSLTLWDQADLAFHALEARVRAKACVNGFNLKIDQGGTAKAEKLPKVLDCLVFMA